MSRKCYRESPAPNCKRSFHFFHQGSFRARRRGGRLAGAHGLGQMRRSDLSQVFI